MMGLVCFVLGLGLLLWLVWGFDGLTSVGDCS